MTTPIIMLALMTGPYLVVRLLSVMTHRQYNYRRAAAIGLVILFIFTGIGHFIQSESMSQMLPTWVAAREFIVSLTGLLEFAIAAGFITQRSRKLTGQITAIMLIVFFPVNIYAAIHQVPMGGHAWGPVYLLIRAPLQLAILLWVYYFTLYQPQPVRQ